MNGGADRIGGAPSRRRALELVEPKTPRFRRTTPLPVQVVDTLVEHCDWHCSARHMAGNGWAERCYVFTKAQGRPITRRAVVETAVS